MSDGIGDLVANLKIDTSEFVAPIKEAASVSEESGQRIVRVVHEQQASWLAMTTAVVPAVAQMTGTVATLAGATITLIKQRAMIIGVAGAWTTAGASLVQYGRYGLSIASWFIPPLKAAAIAATLATVAYKVGTSEMVRNAASAASSNTALRASIDRISQASSKIGTAVAQPFRDIGAAASSVAQSLNPLPAIFEAISFRANQALSAVADGAEWAAPKIQDLADQFNTALYAVNLWSDTSEQSVSSFYAQAAALREQASESARVIALQERQSIQLKQFAHIQQDAADQARRAQELAEIGHMVTIEAIDREIRKQQQLQQIALQNGTFNGTHVADVFNALSKQREGIEAGRITEDTGKAKDSPINSILEAAQQQITALKLGETEAAVIAAAAKGANIEQQASLRELLQQKAALTAANEAQKASERAIHQAAEQQQQKVKQGAAQIQQMRDQIDKLTGAASAADIAMREAFRQGLAQDQIEQIGKLTEQLDALKDTDKTTGSRGNHDGVALAGSSEAARLVMRGIGDHKGQDKLTQIGQQHTSILQQISNNTKQKLHLEINEVHL